MKLCIGLEVQPFELKSKINPKIDKKTFQSHNPVGVVFF